MFGCVARAAERLVFGVEVRFARSSFIFLYAVLAGLGSFLGGVWLFRMGCREVGFWCGGARLTLLAPRILNDVSYETRINHEMHFAWQAQYLVKLEASTLLLRAL